MLGLGPTEIMLGLILCLCLYPRRVYTTCRSLGETIGLLHRAIDGPKEKE